jgi:hypothetical protein
MCENILSSLSTDTLYRIDVKFNIEDSNTIDRIIGRSAHINFIENEKLAKMLLMRYAELFA